jgi:hypothetical protein
MKVRAALALVAGALIPVGACNVAGPETVVGSGKSASEQFGFTGFRRVDVQGPFHIELARSEKFHIAVTADDNILELIQVAKDADVLRIGVGGGNKPVSVRPMTALLVTLAMPALDELRMGGACTGRLIKWSDGPTPLRLTLDGASTLRGRIDVREVVMDVNGASEVDVQGVAKQAALEANGASRLKLRLLTLDKAEVRLSGASSAVVDVKNKLDYDVSGASHLEYAGHPTLGKHETSGASSATPK